MLVLCFDIGGTKCAVSIAREGLILDKAVFPTEEPKGPEQAIANLIAEGRRLLAKGSWKPELIGISCGSPMDWKRGVIQAPANLPSWVEVPIVNLLGRAFGLPAFLDNDANAGALAEHRFGAGRGARNVVFLTFGTGLGSGLILDGRLYRGTNCYAGEFGHLRLTPSGPVGCRKAGSFEGWCSGGGIRQIIELELATWKGPATALRPGSSAKDAGLAAAAGDPFALRIFEICGHHFGLGCAMIIDVINPELIIPGSIFVRCERFLRPAMERALSEAALAPAAAVCRVVPAQLGESIGDYAALSVALDAAEQGWSHTAPN